MESSSPPFERLEASVTIIARHADYPGKQDVITDCLDDIEALLRRGQLTLAQRSWLLAILLEAAPPRRRPMAAP